MEHWWINTIEVAYGLLDELTSNNYQWTSKDSKPRTMARVAEIDAASQLAAINQRLDKLSANSVKTNIICENCVGNHEMAECPMGGGTSPILSR